MQRQRQRRRRPIQHYDFVSLNGTASAPGETKQTPP
jgi:hypothetical protein